MTRRKILIVDDDEFVLKALDARLHGTFDVVTTNDPQVVPMLLRHERPDAILCDIDMPEMGGGDLARALQEDPATVAVPLIYLTSLVSPQELADLGGFISGHRGVSKRAPLAELVEVVERECARAERLASAY